MIEKLKLYAWLALIAAITGMAITIGGYNLQVKTLKADRARLEQTAAVSEKTISSLQKELKTNQTALAEREQKQAELTALTEMLGHELSELYANNEPCAAWADSDIPGPVFDRLRR